MSVFQINCAKTVFILLLSNIEQQLNCSDDTLPIVCAQPTRTPFTVRDGSVRGVVVICVGLLCRPAASASIYLLTFSKYVFSKEMANQRKVSVRNLYVSP